MNAPRYFAGLGCRRGCSENSLRELLESALREHGLDPDQLGGLASIDLKFDEPGLLALAKTLNLPLQLFSADQLAAFADRVTSSAIVEREIGAANVAEASALAAAEAINKTHGNPRAELVIRKFKNAEATFALARISDFSLTRVAVCSLTRVSTFSLTRVSGPDENQ